MAKTFNTKLLNFEHEDLPEEISSNKSFKELLSKLEKIKELLEVGEEFQEGRDFVRSKNGDILFMTPGGYIPIANPSEKSTELYNLGIEIKKTLENMLHQKEKQGYSSKIDKYKLFEYAYDELPEKEMAEVEEFIAKNPEALKIVNEYLFLKQNLKELPEEVPEAIPEKTKDESSIPGQLVASARKYIAWDLRPNLAFAAFALVLGFGIFQYQANQNLALNPSEISQIEQYFTALKRGESPSQPLANIKIKPSPFLSVSLSKVFLGAGGGSFGKHSFVLPSRKS